MLPTARGFSGHNDATVWLKQVPASMQRAYLEDVVRANGGDFVRLLLSDPSKQAYCDTRCASLNCQPAEHFTVVCASVLHSVKPHAAPVAS